MHRLQEIETIVLIKNLVIRTTIPRLQRPRFHTIIYQDGGSFLDRMRLNVIDISPNQLTDLFGREADLNNKQS
jgi:hypothetical protein